MSTYRNSTLCNTAQPSAPQAVRYAHSLRICARHRGQKDCHRSRNEGKKGEGIGVQPLAELRIKAGEKQQQIISMKVVLDVDVALLRRVIQLVLLSSCPTPQDAARRVCFYEAKHDCLFKANAPATRCAEQISEGHMLCPRVRHPVEGC